MQTAVRFSRSRACLIFGVAEYDRQQSKKPWSHHQACSVGIFYAISFGWIWSEEKGLSRPFSLGTTPCFPVPVPATWEGEDLKTDPLTVPLWCSSTDNVTSGVSCSHLLNGHRSCFPSVSSARTAAAVLPRYWHSCPQLQQNMWKWTNPQEDTWKATLGNTPHLLKHVLGYLSP